MDLTSLNKLTGVLCRFRRYPYAVTCDVQMFHQFITREDDRDCLRILYWPNGEVKQARERIQGAREFCKKGGLRLHKFVANDHQVLDQVPKSKRVVHVILDLPSELLPIERSGCSVVSWVN